MEWNLKFQRLTITIALKREMTWLKSVQRERNKNGEKKHQKIQTKDWGVVVIITRTFLCFISFKLMFFSLDRMLCSILFFASSCSWISFWPFFPFVTTQAKFHQSLHLYRTHKCACIVCNIALFVCVCVCLVVVSGVRAVTSSIGTAIVNMHPDWGSTLQKMHRREECGWKAIRFDLIGTSQLWNHGLGTRKGF